MGRPFILRFCLAHGTLKKKVFLEFLPLFENWNISSEIRMSGFLENGRPWQPWVSASGWRLAALALGELIRAGPRAPLASYITAWP